MSPQSRRRPVSVPASHPVIPHAANSKRVWAMNRLLRARAAAAVRRTSLYIAEQCSHCSVVEVGCSTQPHSSGQCCVSRQEHELQKVAGTMPGVLRFTLNWYCVDPLSARASDES